jgi:hypothetical protein
MKPVAWITEWDGKYSSGKILDWVAHARGDSAKHTPLYTAPRELSDEEIEEIETEQRYKWNGAVHVYEFAKAILKKASEK